MVFKLPLFSSELSQSFENDVNMYGIQTNENKVICENMFENDVNMYGIQTIPIYTASEAMFENDVNMYGIQTHLLLFLHSLSLRMM